MNVTRKRDFWGRGLGLLLILGGIGGIEAIAPTPAYSNMVRQSIELYRRGDESYITLLQRAEMVARAAVQRQFDSNIVTTQVDIFVVGKHNGMIVPLLRLQVNRQQWQRQPDPSEWTTYFPIAENLLGL